MLFKESLWLACGRVSNGLSVKINEWEEKVNCKHYHPMSSLLTFRSLSEWVKQKENQKPAERWWWKSFGKWGNIRVDLCDFSWLSSRESFPSTYHIIAVCFIVIVLLLLCWFYGITFFISFTFNTNFLVSQGKITIF